MHRSPRLTLIAPHLVAQANREQAPSASDRADLFGRIAGRGELARCWAATTRQQGRLADWQRALLSSLQLEEGAHPSAATSALGAGLDVGANQWLHADTVHFAAGINEVTLVPLPGETALSLEDRAELAPFLAEHFATGPIRFHAVPAQWFLETPAGWDVQTVTPDFSARHPWSDALPHGNDSGALRRLMTELQMLLHDHPVNQRRARQGLPAANAIWCWGNGTLSSTVDASRAARSVKCWGRSAYLIGLCRLHGWSLPQRPSVEAVIAGSKAAEHSICVIDAHDRQSFDAQWLTPLVDALRRGVFARLDIDFAEWRVSVDRWNLKRFWRRARPLNTWAAV